MSDTAMAPDATADPIDRLAVASVVAWSLSKPSCKHLTPSLARACTPASCPSTRSSDPAMTRSPNTSKRDSPPTACFASTKARDAAAAAGIAMARARLADVPDASALRDNGPSAMDPEADGDRVEAASSRSCRMAPRPVPLSCSIDAIESAGVGLQWELRDSDAN
jgi:hypothetical protein